MKTLITTLFATAILALSFNASAATVNYAIDKSNEASMTQGITYVEVIISDDLVTVGDINFYIEVNNLAFDIVDSENFGMQNFSFNYDTTSNAAGITGLNIVDLAPAWTTSYNANAGGDWGKFELQFDGNGSSRTSVLQFTITGIEDDTIYDYAIGSILNPSSGEFFATHIAGFGGYDGFSSAQFAGSSECDGICDRGLDPPAVPIPASAWLMMSGLIGLVGVGRRKA